MLVFLKRGVAALALTALLAFGVACGGDDNDEAPRLGQPAQTAEGLVDRFITLIQDKDVEGLRSFLSDAFMLQRAEGTFITKNDYLGRLPDIGPYTISNVSANQAGHALVVHWELTVEQVIDGRPYRTDPAPRLSAFVWSDGEWRMLAHANFNVPAQP